MTMEQITARLDKRDREYKTELADLDKRIEEAKAASEAAELAVDAATRTTDATAYHKAQREANFHNETLEMLQRRKADLKKPYMAASEYAEMCAAVKAELMDESMECLKWAVETADLGKQYCDELWEKQKKANAILCRLADASGITPPQSLKGFWGLRIESIGFLMRAMYNHGWYKEAREIVGEED